MSNDPGNARLSNLPDDLLDRYLARQLSADERTFVFAQLALDPRAAALVTAVERSCFGSAASTIEALEDARARIARRMGRKPLQGMPSLGKQTLPGDVPSSMPSLVPSSRAAVLSLRWAWYRGMRYAAGGAVIALAAVVIAREISRTTLSRTVTSQTFTAPRVMKARMVLSHGVRAILAPGTRVRVTNTDGGTTVVLDGEALFTVSQASAHPFVVQTRSAAARVLGTRFSVRQYTDDRSARIVVVDGRISVGQVREAVGAGSRAGAATISSGMMALVSDSGEVAVTQRVLTEQYLAWTDGRLIFRETPVRDALRELGRAYDVEFRLADSAMARYPLTWSVTVWHESLESTLDELSEILGTHFTRTGRVITIARGRGTSARDRYPEHPFTSESQYGR